MSGRSTSILEDPHGLIDNEPKSILSIKFLN